MSDDEAEDYHAEQAGVLAATGVDLVHATTISYTAEAIGIARAAARARVPAAISFTTETDRRLPDGTSLTGAVTAVDAATGGGPAYYGFNCAHPTHFGPALPGGAIGARIRSIRANASRKIHAELNESPALDDGDPIELAGDYVRLRAQHPSVSVLGGCCGTATRHVQAIADAVLTRQCIQRSNIPLITRAGQPPRNGCSAGRMKAGPWIKPERIVGSDLLGSV